MRGTGLELELQWRSISPDEQAAAMWFAFSLGAFDGQYFFGLLWFGEIFE